MGRTWCLRPIGTVRRLTSIAEASRMTSLVAAPPTSQAVNTNQYTKLAIGLHTIILNPYMGKMNILSITPSMDLIREGPIPKRPKIPNGQP